LKGLSKVVIHKNGGCILGNTILETANLYPSFRHLLTTIMDGIVQSFANIYQELYSQEQSQILAQQTLMELEGAIMFSKLYSNPSIFQDFQKRMIQRVETDS
jgi:TetR/AcrR family transcriptional repressor of nem operon